MTNPHPQEPREVMTEAQADAFQQWGKLDGAAAWHLIERHADDWHQIGMMMDAWLRANAPALPAVSVVPGEKVLAREPTEEMVSAAFLHFNRNTPPTNPSGNWKAALRAAWDAAPLLAPPAAREAVVEWPEEPAHIRTLRALAAGELAGEFCLAKSGRETLNYIDRLLELAAVGKAPAAPNNGTTHSEECWRWHLSCAVEKIERGAAPEVGSAEWHTQQFLLSLAPAAKEKK